MALELPYINLQGGLLDGHILVCETVPVPLLWGICHVLETAGASEDDCLHLSRLEKSWTRRNADPDASSSCHQQSHCQQQKLTEIPFLELPVAQAAILQEYLWRSIPARLSDTVIHEQRGLVCDSAQVSNRQPELEIERLRDPGAGASPDNFRAWQSRLLLWPRRTTEFGSLLWVNTLTSENPQQQRECSPLCPSGRWHGRGRSRY